MSFQTSYASVLGRFKAGLEVLKSDTNYTPQNVAIQLPNLISLVSKIEEKNLLVDNNLLTMRTARAERRAISFSTTSSTTNCLETVLKNLLNYIGAEHSVNSAVYKQLKSYLSKIKPPRKGSEGSNSDNPNSSTTISRSEATYSSLTNIGRQVVQIITQPNFSYTPSNPNLSIANITDLVNSLETLNITIANAQQAYSKSVSERKHLYDSSEGIKKLLPTIKLFLKSYDGGTKNETYNQFLNALKKD